MSLPAKVLDKLNTETGKPHTLSLNNALPALNYLGLLMAHLARFQRCLFSTLAGLSNVNKVGHFYLPTISSSKVWTKTKPASACNTDQLLTSNERGTFAVANRDSTDILQDGNFDHLSEAELSALLDLLQSQIEHHRDELTRLKPLLHRLQAQIPNNPFFDFINSLKD